MVKNTSVGSNEKSYLKSKEQQNPVYVNNMQEKQKYWKKYTESLRGQQSFSVYSEAWMYLQP